MSSNIEITKAVYQYLVKCAQDKRTTTYSEVAEHVRETLDDKFPTTGNALGSRLGSILGDVYRFCESRKMPYLTALVLKKSGPGAGIPGEGFWTLYDISALISQLNDRMRNGELALKEGFARELVKSVYAYWDMELSNVGRLEFAPIKGMNSGLD